MWTVLAVLVEQSGLHVDCAGCRVVKQSRLSVDCAVLIKQ